MIRLGAAHELPAELPQDEHVLWQGAPSWWALARSLHLAAASGYFAFVFAAYAAHAVQTGQVSAAGLARMAALSVAVPVLILCYAWLVSRTASYTLTNRRLVLQSGVALPLSINVPFARIARADLALARDGSGNIVLCLAGADRLGFVLLWPHAQPWHFARARPMLRAVPQAARLAQHLARLLEASREEDMVEPRGVVAQSGSVVPGSVAPAPFVPLTEAA